MKEQDVSSKKQIFANLVWGIIAGALSYCINFLLTPVITARLGIDAYGFFSLGNTMISYINIISVGINSFSARYIAVEYHKGNIHEANSYYSSVMAANMLLSVLILIPASIIIYNLESFISISQTLQVDVKILFVLVLANYLLGLISSVFSTLAFIKNKIGATSKIKGVSVLAYAGILVSIFYFIDIRIYYVAFANMVASIIILVANFYYSRILVPEIKVDFRKFSLSKVKRLTSAGIYNSINSLGGTLGSGLDLLVTNIYLSSITMGQIAVGNQVGGILYIVITLVANAFQPKQLEAYSHKHTKELISYFQVSMKTCGLIADVFWGCFLFLGMSFFQLWIPGQNCELIYNISLIIIIGNLIVAIVTPLYYVTTLTVKMKSVCLITVACGLVNVLSMMILLNIVSTGAYIIVGTTAVLDLVSLIVFPYITRKYLELDSNPFIKLIFKHFACSFFIFVFYKVFPYEIKVDSWSELIIWGVIMVCIITFITGLIQFDSKEKQMIRRILINKLKR